MEYLLDTHTLIWSLLEPENISRNVLTILENRRNKIYVSIVSFWEIATKIAVGKLSEEKYSLERFVRQCRKYHFKLLTVELKHIMLYQHLPLFPNHRDPFDRMLIATAIENGFTLLSRDAKLPQYDGTGLSHIW